MSEVKIQVRDNGPLLVQGPITVIDADGGTFPIDPSKPAVALCRCGQSSRRPFCDGTHSKVGFQAAERVPPS